MYAPLGDVPLILQGGGAYNTPPATAPAPVSPLLLYGLGGLLITYLVMGSSRGRKVW